MIKLQIVETVLKETKKTSRSLILTCVSTYGYPKFDFYNDISYKGIQTCQTLPKISN